MKTISKLTVMIALLLGPTVVTTAASLTTAPQASASTCFKTANVSGRNAIGYGRFSSLHSWTGYVRTAPTATLCINYARAYGGYYFASVSCAQSSARLTSDSTSLQRANNYVNHINHTSSYFLVPCGALVHTAGSSSQCRRPNDHRIGGPHQKPSTRAGQRASLSPCDTSGRSFRSCLPRRHAR